MMIGTQDWSMLKHPLRSIIGQSSKTVYLVLNFYKKIATLPKIGVATLPAKQLFWEIESEDNRKKRTQHITLLEWSEQDKNFWDGIQCGYKNSVTLMLWINHAAPMEFKLCLESCGKRSSVYSFLACPVTGDAFLMFMTPIDKFVNSKNNKPGQLSLMTEEEFKFEYSKRMANCFSSQKLGAHFSNCVACIEAKAQIVLWPCGHAAFCSKCYKHFTGNKCPLCITDLNMYLELRSQKLVIPETGAMCLACPSSMKCTTMNCMVQPCGCVVGCLEFAERCFFPGEDNCPNCKGTIEALVKVYVQSEGNEQMEENKPEPVTTKWIARGRFARGRGGRPKH